MTIGEWLAGIEGERDRVRYDPTELRDAAAEAVRGVPRERLPLRLAKRRIELLNTCPRRAVAEASAGFDGSSELFLIGTLVERAARMHLWNRYPAGDPDAVRAALVEHATARGEILPELTDDVWETVTLRADRFARSWKNPQRGVDIHVGERLVVPLAHDADGRPGVVLTGITDVSIGAHVASDPHQPRAVLELKSGRTPWNPLAESLWYQFMVSATDGYAPHRVGVWSAVPNTDHHFGDLVDSPITTGSLATATRWVSDALVLVGALAAGEKPEERPSPLCRTCPDRSSCPSAATGLALGHASDAAAGLDDGLDDGLDWDDADRALGGDDAGA